MIPRFLFKQVPLLLIAFVLFVYAPPVRADTLLDDFSNFPSGNGWFGGDTTGQTNLGDWSQSISGGCNYGDSYCASPNGSQNFPTTLMPVSLGTSGFITARVKLDTSSATGGTETNFIFGVASSTNDVKAFFKNYVLYTVSHGGSDPNDDTWHTVSLGWKTVSGEFLTCGLFDDTDEADCTYATSSISAGPLRWGDSNVMVPGSAVNYIYLTNYGYDHSGVYVDQVTSGTAPGSGLSTSTRIVSFTPAEGETVGNDVTFDLHVYVNPSDITSFKGISLSYKSVDQNYIISIPFLSHDQYLISEEDIGAGDFYYHNVVTLPNGNYRAQAKIERTLIGLIVNPFDSVNDTQNHQFVVNEESYVGHLNQNGFNEFNAILGSTTATSTAAAAANCNPLTFSISQCLAFLFIPGGPQLDETVASFKDGVVTRVPWGYFYRLYEIVSGTTTSALPTYTANIRIGPPSNLSTTSLTYDPGDMIAGGGELLGSITDPEHGMTVRQVFEPYILLIIAIVVLLQIWHDITGSHRHHIPTPGKRQ